MKDKSPILLMIILLTVIMFVPTIHAQEDASLARDARNPLADMVSLLIQSEVYLGIGPDDESANVTTFQPVYPIHLGDDWNLITRTLVPLVWVPESVEGLNVRPQGVGADTKFGLGDINLTGFFSPTKTGKFIWGFGPALTFPTASDDLLGSQKWSAGPSAVVLVQSGRWNNGILARHLSSFAGEEDRARVNQTLIQPWIVYMLNQEWCVFTDPVIQRIGSRMIAISGLWSLLAAG